MLKIRNLAESHAAMRLNYLLAIDLIRLFCAAFSPFKKQCHLIFIKTSVKPPRLRGVYKRIKKTVAPKGAKLWSRES